MFKIRSKPFLIALFVTACLSNTSQANEANIEITSRLSHPYLEPNKEQTVFLKIGLKGKPTKLEKHRAPINLSLVLDKSGSMQGQKLADVKKAAKMLVDRLTPEDTLSIIAYDNEAKILIPATHLTNPITIKNEIDQLYAGGGTALYSGVQYGARELKRFMSDNKVNRIILLSDGIANVGPSSPHALANLGRTLAQENISVSTIGLGLGYNEDVMFQLASSADGFHQFAEDTYALQHAFDWQFGKLSSTVANNAKVTINFAPNVTPIRILGREGTLHDGIAHFDLNNIYTTHEVYV